jgi:hypothetical protein
MFSQEKLLKVIDADMRACRDATPIPTDAPGKERQSLELATLARHLERAKSVGDDQAALEQIVQSLEKNMVVRYQRWRELSTV